MSYLLTGGFMIMDIITGLIKSFKDKNYTSSIMREGLYHKCGYILCIFLFWLIDYTGEYLDLGIEFTITPVVCVYIILNECGSIIENLGEINPTLLPESLQEYFGKLKR